MASKDAASGDGRTAERRVDNFDTLRCLAALMVLGSHAFPLSSPIDREPLQLLTGGQTSFGAVAVLTFFAISGYLITWSYERSRSPALYCVSRALRILPGLIASLLVCALVLGPMATILPLTDYFSSAQLYRFVFGNIMMVHGTAGLPGVFLDNPVANGVNGSLWTIRYEVLMYLVVLGLGVCGLLNARVTAILAAATALAWALSGRNELALIVTFFLGGLLHFLRDRITPSTTGALIAAGVLIVATFLGALRVVLCPAVAFIVLYLATSPRIRLPNLGRYGDLSYGIYLYAFPSEQLVVQAFGDQATWYVVILLSLPPTIVAALLSWHLIENPALALKRRFQFRTAHAS